MDGAGENRTNLRRIPGPNAVTAVLAIASMGASFMQTLVLPIQAELPELLGAERQATAWVVTVTLLASCIAYPIAGRLGDLYGKRRVALALLGCLVLGSVIAALSTNLIGLLVGRALQGFVMGFIPVAIAILRDVLPLERLNGGVALVSATLGVGGAIGLVLSAVVAQFLDWHALFWCAAALGAITLALVFWLVPVSVLRSPGQLDLVGAAGLSLGLGSILVAISQGDEWGWISPLTLGLTGGGVVVLLLWGWYELRQASPLVDLRISARPAVLFTNLSALTVGFGFFASSIALPQLLELPAGTGTGAGMGLTLLMAGLVLLPGALVGVAMTPVATWIANRWSAKILIAVGPALCAAGYVLALVAHSEVWQLLIVNILENVGIGLSFAGMPMIIMRSEPSTETASANSINSLGRSLGTTSASAVIAVILSAHSVKLGSAELPTIDGFLLAFVVSGIVALVSVGFALLVPARPASERRPAVP